MRFLQRRTLPGWSLCVLAALLPFAPVCANDAPAGRFGGNAGLFERMLAAEDARPRDAAGRAPLLEGLASGNEEIRRLAVRALGRLEQDAVVPDIVPLLEDDTPVVRAEAANALAQAVRNGAATAARAALEARAASEPHARVLGVIAESLGRLPHVSAEAAAATAVLLTGLSLDTRVAPTTGTTDTDTTSPGADVALRLGIARGLFFLSRQPAARGAMPAEAVAKLRELLVTGLAATTDTLRSRRVRSVAAAALVASGGATAAHLAVLFDDPHPLVRREAAVGLAGLHGAERDVLEVRALADASAAVRYDALRMLAQRADADVCPRILGAMRDPGSHVALQAIGLAGSRCSGEPAAGVIDSIAATLPPGADGWHAATRALVALAALSPDRARNRLPPFIVHPVFFVRAWAAQAAAAVGDTDALYTLATDLHPNVRFAAVNGLSTLVGHGADEIFIAQLGESDSQLLQSAAAALEGTQHSGALPALLGALERVTAVRHETLRAARRALLDRIRELGSPADAERLQRYLRDYDPAIATLAADLIGEWTGARPEPAPQPLPRAAMPALDELESLADARIVIEMAGGGVIELTLRPFDAPANVSRFARLARAGWFNGLTFHRIAPNFVVQGGSPNANEYAGDGPYTRDELVIDANWRGTVGLSTRGRDTGDAQIYVNLIDNVRLDHDYTIFADVVRGMDIVDGLLEGAVIRNITLR